MKCLSLDFHRCEFGGFPGTHRGPAARVTAASGMPGGAERRSAGELLEIRLKLRKRINQPLGETARWLKRVVQGWLNYHAVENFPSFGIGKALDHAREITKKENPRKLNFQTGRSLAELDRELEQEIAGLQAEAECVAEEAGIRKSPSFHESDSSVGR